jgi:uncharacterized membrane protein YphA (DoxX/SURF4 family)
MNGWLGQLLKREDVFFELIRIYLGIGLFIRGILFLADSSALTSWLTQAGEVQFGTVALTHYIAFAHLGGGLMLATGIATRIAALLQLPILIGAVFVVHLAEGLSTTNQSLEFSALVLVLLVLVFIRGSGSLSLDEYVARKDAESKLKVVRSEQAKRSKPQPVVEPEAVAVVEAETRAPVPVLETVGPELEEVKMCSCGHDRNHVLVSPRPRYSLMGWIMLLMGTRVTPAEVQYQCRKCDEVFDRSRDLETRLELR